MNLTYFINKISKIFENLNFNIKVEYFTNKNLILSLFIKSFYQSFNIAKF